MSSESCVRVVLRVKDGDRQIVQLESIVDTIPKVGSMDGSCFPMSSTWLNATMPK